MTAAGATAWWGLAGALAAAAIAWASIAAFAWLGRDHLNLGPVRWGGAAALGALALTVAGVPVPWLAPPALLGAGVAAGWVGARGEKGRSVPPRTGE